MNDKKQAFLDTYFEDAEELLQNINEILLELEKSPHDGEALNSLFRYIHTFKGTSSFMGFKQISNFSHEIESVLDAVRQGMITLREDAIDALFQSFEYLKQNYLFDHQGKSQFYHRHYPLL